MIKVLFFMDGIGNAGGIQEMAIKWMENIDRSKVKIDILTYNHVKADNYKDRVKALGGEVYVIESFQDKNKFLLSMKQTASFLSSIPIITLFMPMLLLKHFLFFGSLNEVVLR